MSESSIRIKLSDPIDLETANLEKELMSYCGYHQALQQSQEISHWGRTYSVTTEHPSFQANLICTALTRCVVQITKLLDMVREEEGAFRQKQHACCPGQCWLWYSPHSPHGQLTFGASELTSCRVCSSSRSFIPCFLEQQSKVQYRLSPPCKVRCSVRDK